MAKLEKSVTIRAPVGKVFDYLSIPGIFPIWPSMVAVKDVQPSSKGGNNFSWTYKMAGMSFEGASEAPNIPPTSALSLRTRKASRASSSGLTSRRREGRS